MMYLGDNPIGLACNLNKYDYEEGIYIPTQDIAGPTINFVTVHNKRPLMVTLVDSINTSAPIANSLVAWYIIDHSQYTTLGDQFYIASADTESTGIYVLLYRTDMSIGMTTIFLSDLYNNSIRDMGVYLTNSYFIPKAGSNNYYLRAGRTYKWVAIWNKQEVTSNAS